MADLEAQTQTGAQRSEIQSALMARRELRQLVQMLADSVKLVQSMVELDDERRPNQNDEHIELRTIEADSESENYVVEQGEMIGDDNEHEEGERVAKMPVLSQEEILNWMLAKQREFERLSVAKGISKDITVDSWRSLKYLDWDYYRRRMQRSDSQPDVVPNQQVIPGIIRHYLEHPDLRLEVQKEIYYSLSRWWWSNASSPSRPDIRPRGILDMGPWIALIGMRLPRYEDGKEVDKTGSKDLVRLRMLTIILDLPQLERWSDRYEAGKEGIFWADIVTVGQALDQCYRYRVLEQPTPQDIVAYQDHVKELIHTLKLVNLWHSMNMYRPEKHLHSVHEIRTMKMSSLVDKIGFHEFYGELGESQSPNFQSYELSLELLRTVGKLKIEWTEYPNEHLHLDVENSSLKIFWFGFSIMANPIFHMGCRRWDGIDTFCHESHPDLSYIVSQLSKTYSLLFRSRRDTYKENLREYGLLPVPQWLRICYADEHGTLPFRAAPDMSYFLHPKRERVSEIENHLAEANTRLPPTQSFDNYHIWQDRLRELKTYMDGQKPGGIRGLWADKRDSGQWYTFWAVIIIGGLGLILSFLGLVAGIVQAVGTFQGLH